MGRPGNGASPRVAAQVPAQVAEAICRAASSLGPEAGADAGAWRDAAVLAALDRAQGAGDDVAVLDLARSYDRLLGTVPARRDGEVVLLAAGLTERRRRGSFATPPHLAAELARRALPEPVASVVDPACGAGSLLVAALDRLVEHGIPAGEAVSRLAGADADPVAVALCRAALPARARQLAMAAGRAGSEAMGTPRIRCGDALLGPVPSTPSASIARAGPGLVWHAEFPDVLAVTGLPAEPVTGWCGGFEAVLANPPWERLKVFRREAPDRVDGALRRLRAGQSRAVRTGGRHPLTGRGEVNAYLPFVETCWRLLAPRGRAAILVPAGIGADRSAAELMRALLESGSLRALHLLATDRAVFDGVSARVGVALLELRHGAHETEAPGRAEPAEPAEVAVDVRNPADIPAERRWLLPADLPRLVNPNTATLPLCGSARDADLLARAHRRWPVLVRHGGEGSDGNPWQVRLLTPLHMTRDAVHFHSAAGPGLVPLWEAKHAGLLDHRGGSRAEHRYWVPESVVAQRFSGLVDRGWLGAYRNVTTTDSARTLVPCALPVAGVGNSLPLIDAPRLPLLLTVMAALPVDYLVRQKHAGANLNFFKLEQAAVPEPGAYEAVTAFSGGERLDRWLLTRLASSIRWDETLTPLARELTALGVDLTAARRQGREEALAEIDAAHALLLGWTRAELEHVVGTFAALRARELRTVGDFATATRVLAAFDRLATC
ncbi:MAG: N-6 DNA methylase [Kineosporiaceae bacterium]|nr:N-6 DNA methylase [Kineosporiaceae bacterium]